MNRLATPIEPRNEFSPMNQNNRYLPPNPAPLRPAQRVHWRRALLAVGWLLLPLATPSVMADQVLKLSKEQRASLVLETQKVTMSDQIPVTQGIARIAPAPSDQASHRVMAPLSGLVVGDLPSVGDAVKVGQILARLDSDQLADYLAQWQSAAANALAARHALSRDKALFADGLIPRKRLEGTQAAAAMAKAHLQAARARLATAGVTDPAELEQQGSAAGKGAVIQVKAPTAGVVTQRSVMPGDRVTQGQPLFEITSADQQWWLLSVPPDLLPPAGTPLWLNIADCPQPAKVKLVDLAVDSASQMVTLRAQAAQACTRLRPGQYVDATLTRKADQPVAKVPLASVTRLAKQEQVYIARGGEIRAVNVKVLGRGHGLAYVSGALRAGDQVISKGISRLKGIELGLGGE